MALVFATFAFSMLVYLYGGYWFFLKLLKHWQKFGDDDSCGEEFYPKLTILITVFNEAKNIEGRIRNVLACEYPADKLEILLASDGSTDGTDAIVAGMEDARIRLFRPAERKGKTDTQNQAIATATGEIVVFTDAETKFDAIFLQEIARPFNDSHVGGVDGHLLFLTETADGVSRSQVFYWRQELQIRELESKLGILAVASGACMAIRRSLFRPMLATVGEDCLIPLNVVDQGYRMVHAEKAIAYDRMEHDPKKEFRTRVRMTLRNWQGTWSYPHLLNPFSHPGYAFSLWSHKVLRWLSPIFLLMWLVGSLILLIEEPLVFWVGLPAAGFLLLALLGALRVRLPGASMAYSFSLANAGFAAGVAKAIIGGKILSYK